MYSEFAAPMFAKKNVPEHLKRNFSFENDFYKFTNNFVRVNCKLLQNYKDIRKRK